MPDPYVCFRKKKVFNLLIQFNKTGNTVKYREDDVKLNDIVYILYLNFIKILHKTAFYHFFKCEIILQPTS